MNIGHNKLKIGRQNVTYIIGITAILSLYFRFKNPISTRHYKTLPPAHVHCKWHVRSFTERRQTSCGYKILCANCSHLCAKQQSKRR